MHLIVELLNVSKNSFFKLLATFPSICASNIKFLIHHLYCIRFLSFRVSTFSTSNPSQDVVLTDAVDNNHKQTKKVLENVLYALFMTFQIISIKIMFSTFPTKTYFSLLALGSKKISLYHNLKKLQMTKLLAYSYIKMSTNLTFACDPKTRLSTNVIETT